METLTERDQAFIEGIAKGIADAVQPHPVKPEPKPETSPEPTVNLAQLIQSAAPGSRFKIGDVEISAAEANKPEPAGEDDSKEPKVAEQHAALLRPLERPFSGVSFAGVDVGPLAIGGLTGIIGAEVINGITPRKEAAPTGGLTVNWKNAGAKLAAVAAIGSFGDQIMSKNSRIVAGGILAAQAIQDILPVDNWVNWIVNQVNPPPAGTTTTAQHRVAAHQSRRSAPAGTNLGEVVSRAGSANTAGLESVLGRSSR